MRVMHIWKNPPWGLFWYSYFLLADRHEDFVLDYCAAWKLQPGIDSQLVLFVDNGKRLSVPCSTAAHDAELLAHLRIFYNLIRTGGGIFELLGAKSSQRIDVVEVRHLLLMLYNAHAHVTNGEISSTNRLAQ